MRYCRHLIAACSVIVCVVVLTSCGDGATERFKTGYNAARAPLKQTFVDLADAFNHATGKSMPVIAHSLGVLADRFRKELAPLEALKPPARVAPPFRMLTRSLKRVERDIRATYGAVKHRDVAAAQRVTWSLQSDARVAADAAAAVTRKLDHK